MEATLHQHGSARVPRMHRYEWGAAAGKAPLLHFAHANGFNGLTYRFLLEPLSDRLTVYASDLRGHGRTALPADPAEPYTWELYRDDLIADLEPLASAHGPVLLSGHSMGGTASLLVARDRPDLVAGLILAEPVIIPPVAIWMMDLRRYLRVRRPTYPMGTAALRRRAEWPDRETMLRAYRGRGAFRTWPEEAVRDYIEGGTRPLANGTVALACAPAWEAANFSTYATSLWRGLDKVACPVTILYGSRHSTFIWAVRNKFARTVPQAKLIHIEGTGHFLPMERPEAVACEILAMAGIP